jgi:hypothetical protein
MALHSPGAYSFLAEVAPARRRWRQGYPADEASGSPARRKEIYPRSNDPHLVSFDANTTGGQEPNQNRLNFRGLGIPAKWRPRAAKPSTETTADSLFNLCH